MKQSLREAPFFPFRQAQPSLPPLPLPPRLKLPGFSSGSRSASRVRPWAARDGAIQPLLASSSSPPQVLSSSSRSSAPRGSQWWGPSRLPPSLRHPRLRHHPLLQRPRLPGRPGPHRAPLQARLHRPRPLRQNTRTWRFLWGNRKK